MKNAKQIWEETAKQLEKVYDAREAENITYLLMEDVFSISKAAILSKELVHVDEDELSSATERLLNHEPIQYVTGLADFYGRQFQIEKGALIPRPETEELISLIKSNVRIKEPKMLDVGTGSGCIAITLSLEIGGAVFATDVSSKALDIANDNAKKLNAKVSFIEHDVLQNDLTLSDLDVLVSNPPYIPQKERVQMNQNVTDFEPDLALFVPDDDPLLFYRKIATSGRHVLKSGGMLFFEIHENFGRQTKELLEGLNYSAVKVHQDMQGKDRMVSAIN